MTRVEIVVAAERQTDVIMALRGLDRDEVAGRLERCMATRLARRDDPAAAQTWPWRCGSAGCCWCGRTALCRGWRTCLRWGRGEVQRSLVVIPLPHCPGGLRRAVATARRSLRDLLDGEVGKSRRWLAVGVGGVTVGDSVWLVAIHARLDRQELARVMQRRWPTAQISSDIPIHVPFEFTTDDHVELALARRGGEEIFKVVVGLRQVDGNPNHQQFAGRSVVDQPMPFVF